MLAPPVGSQTLVWWAREPLSVPSRPGTSSYMLHAKSNGKACTHVLPHATTASEPTSLLREGSSPATCPRLQTLPLRLGGLQ
jgi:hypothetical protein